MDLLLLLDIGVVLSDAEQSQLLHQVDLVRGAHVSLEEGVHGGREGGREEHDLAVGREVDEQFFGPLYHSSVDFTTTSSSTTASTYYSLHSL